MSKLTAEQYKLLGLLYNGLPYPGTPWHPKDESALYDGGYITFRDDVITTTMKGRLTFANHQNQSRAAEVSFYTIHDPASLTANAGVYGEPPRPAVFLRPVDSSFGKGPTVILFESAAQAEAVASALKGPWPTINDVPGK